MTSSSYRNPGSSQTINYQIDGDPSIAPGLAAEANALCFRSDIPSLYAHSGPLDTDWTLIGSGSGGASGPPNALGFFDSAPPLSAPLIGDNLLYYIDPITKDVFLGGLQGVTRLYINQDASFNSNAGLQHSSLVANRAQYRGNQFGANTGIPGITGFKSRGATITSLAAVLAGDVLFRATAIGVTGNNADIPLAGSISINAAFVAPNYVATDFEVALVSLAGPINSRRPVFIVDSEGVLHVKEGANAMAGVAVTGAGGTIIVPNTRITANTRIALTVQDGGVAPTNGMYVSGRVVGASFTIQMIVAGDVGVSVYYQLYEPIP